MLLATIVWLTLSVTAGAEVRTWTDSSGAFSVRAEFVRLEGETVVLEGTDGSEMEIPLEKLSGSDQAVARTAAAAMKPANPFQQRAANPFQPKGAGAAIPATANESREDARDDRPVEKRTLSISSNEAEELFARVGNWTAAPDEPQRERLDHEKVIRFHGYRDRIFDKLNGSVVNAGDGTLALSYGLTLGSGFEPAATVVTVIDLLAGKESHVAAARGNWRVLDVSAEGSLVLVGWNDRDLNPGFGSVQLWRVQPRAKGRGKLSTEPPLGLIDRPGSGQQPAVLWQATPIAPAERGFSKGQVTWGAMLDGGLVAVYGDKRVLVFDPNADAAVFTIDDLAARPAVSPNRRLLAIPRDGQVLLYDVANRELAGGVDTSGRYGLSSLQFSSDGRQLMFVQLNTFLAYSLEDGRELVSSPIAGTGYRGSRCGPITDDLYFVKGLLLDTRTDVPLWHYNGAELVLPFDGSLVAVIHGPTGTGREDGVVVPMAEPRPVIAEAIEKANAVGSGIFALPQGGSVEIDVSSLPANERAAVETAIRDAADDAGYTVVESGGDVTLKTTVTRKPAESREFIQGGFGMPFGIGGGERQTASVSPSVMTLKAEKNGEEVWSTSSVADAWSTDVKKGESLQQAINRATQPNYDAFQTMTIPRQILEPEVSQRAFGSTKISPQGIEDTRAR